MQFTRLLTSTFVLFAIIFSACQAANPADEKMIIVRAGDHFRLGVVAADIDKDNQDKLGVKEGAYIIKVMDDTEAERIGLKKEDVITKFDGKNVKSADDLHDIVSDLEEEKDVMINVTRGGKELSFKAKLQKVDEDQAVEVFVDGEDFHFNMDNFSAPEHFDIFLNKDDNKGGFLGINVKTVSESMYEYFEVKHGVLVEGVVEDSPAEKAGMKAGDVITKVNDREIKDYDDLIRTLNYYNPEEKVTVYYSRKGKEKSTSVTLGEKKVRKIGKRKMIFEGDHTPGKLEWVDEDKKVINIRKELKGPGKRIKIKAPNKKLMII